MGTGKKPPTEVSAKQLRYVKGLISGLSNYQSALAAGYKEGYARNAGQTLSKKPLIAALLTKHRTQLAKETNYALKEAHDEVQERIDAAHADGNHTAVATMLQLKMKLHGLLIERVDQRQVGQFQINIGGLDLPQSQPEKEINPFD